MKVLIAVHGFPPTRVTGAEQAAERIARWLAANGHIVRVFALERYDSPSPHLEVDNYEGIVCYRLNYNLQEAPSGSSLRYDNPEIGQQFKHVLQQEDFDIVHVISGYLLGGQIIRIAHEHGLPTILTLTEYWFMCSRLNLLRVDGSICSGPESPEKCTVCVMQEKRRYRMPEQYAPGLSAPFWQIVRHSSHFKAQLASLKSRLALSREALATADTVISPSHFLVSKFAEFDFQTDRWIVIRHGIKDPSQNQDLTQLQERSGSLRLGYIGQLTPHKGLDLVVRAAIKLLDEGKDISLHIWGHIDHPTPYHDSLKAMSKDYPAIQWQGGFRGNQLWDVLNSLDALVVPSRWYENCPTVILEANKMKKPVIATRLGGMAELIEHDKSGLLFELNDSDDLSLQLSRLVDEPDLLEKLKAGIPYVKTEDEEVTEIFNQYTQVLGK